MKKLVPLYILVNVVLASCTTIIPESVPATATLPSLPCPTPTVVYINASAESPTSNLTPDVFVGLGPSDGVTVTGELGVFTADRSGPVQVKLVPDKLNFFHVEGRVKRVDFGGGCVLGDYDLRTTLEIRHISEPTPTP